MTEQDLNRVQYLYLNNFIGDYNKLKSFFERNCKAYLESIKGTPIRIICLDIDHVKDFALPFMRYLKEVSPKEKVTLDIYPGPDILDGENQIDNWEYIKFIFGDLGELPYRNGGKKNTSLAKYERKIKNFRTSKLKFRDEKSKSESSTEKKLYHTNSEWEVQLHESFDKVSSFGQGRYHFAFCCLSFHYIKNWRLISEKVLHSLAPKACFFYAEVTKDFQFIDGNFSDQAYLNSIKTNNNKSLLLQLFQVFDKTRSEQALFWKPEIRMSDYTALTDYLYPYFSNIVVAEEFEVKGWNNAFKLKEDVHDRWMQKGLLSYLKIGAEGVAEQIKNQIELPANRTVRIHKGFHLYCAKAFLSEKHGGQKQVGKKAVKFDKWKFHHLLSKVQRLEDEKFEALARKTLDLALSHDCFFPERTKLLATLAWEEDSTHKKYPVTLVQDQSASAYSSRFIEYVVRQRTTHWQPNDFFFIKSKQKISVSIQLVADGITKGTGIVYEWKEKDKTDENKMHTSMLRFNFSKGDKGKLTRLDIQMEQKFGKPYHYDSSCPLKITDKLGTKIAIKELLRLSFDKAQLDALAAQLENPNLSLIDTDKDFNSYNKNDPNLLKIYQQFYPNEAEKPDKEFCASLIYSLVFIRVHLLKELGDTLSFFPSSIAQQEENKGFGGFVLLEHYGNKTEQTAFDSIKTARNAALQEAANILFYKASLSSIGNKDVKEKSLQAATAAIIARSGSHGLGSHVLPAVSHESYKPSSNQILFSYLQQRFDFIAQVASEFPTWTFPARFNSDLMMRFYMQRNLLDTLVRAEGIRAYDFNADIEREEIDWDNLALLGGTLKQEKQKLKQYALHGFIYSINIEQGIISVVRRYPKEVPTHIFECKLKKNTAVFKEITATAALIGRQIRLIGDVKQIGSETSSMEECSIIQHKLILKVRKRGFIRYKNIQKLTRIDKIDASVQTPTLQKDNLQVYDVGKSKKLKESLATSEKEQVLFYGVLYEDISPSTKTVKLLASNSVDQSQKEENHIIECELNETVEAEKAQFLKKNTRLYIAGKSIQADGRFRIIAASIHSMVHINYLVGALFKEDGDLSLDIPIAIPGGVVGYQAFFTILENIIRNSAKHTWASLSPVAKFAKNLELKIELVEKESSDDTYVSCKIWTNINNLLTKRDGTSFEYVEVLDMEESKTGNKSKEELPVHQYINEIFGDKLVDDKRNLKRDNLGLSETKIAAGYLNKASLSEIGGFGKSILLRNGKGYIRASAAWELENDKLIPRLGIRIKLNKPKELIYLHRTKDTRLAFLDSDHSIVSLYEAKWDQHFLDYDFCVLRFDELKHANKPPALVEILNNLLNTHSRDNEKFEAAKDSFLEELTYYPFRLIVVAEAKDIKAFIGEGKVKDKKSGEKYIYQDFPIIKQRILFIKQPEFDALTKVSEDETETFKIALYDRWISHINYIRELKKHSPTDPSFAMYVELGLTRFKKNEIIEVNTLSNIYNYSKEAIIKEFCNAIKEEYNEDELNRIRMQLKKNNPIKENTYHLTALIRHWLDGIYSDEKEQAKKLGHIKILRTIFKSFIEPYRNLFEQNISQVNTLPFIYRPPINQTTKESDNPFETHFWQNKSEDARRIALACTQKEPAKLLKQILYGRHETQDRDQHLYLEYLSGGQIFYSILKKPPKKTTYAFQQLIRQLTENAFPRVMIMDERVANYVNKHQRRARLCNQNLIIPTKVSITPKNGSSFSPIEHECKEESLTPAPVITTEVAGTKMEISYSDNNKNISIPVEAEAYKHKISVLIIHQSIFEETFKNKKEQAKLVDGFIKAIKIQHIPCVIITSGRGRPQALSKYAKFLPFSNIESFILQRYPEKFLLTQTLFKSIRKKEVK